MLSHSRSHDTWKKVEGSGKMMSYNVETHVDLKAYTWSFRADH